MENNNNNDIGIINNEINKIILKKEFDNLEKLTENEDILINSCFLSTNFQQCVWKSIINHFNGHKNRYKDIIPKEETRVKLNVVEPYGYKEYQIRGDEDYINANYIHGEIEESTNYYIASQAPLLSTINDFWRMIWEQSCGVIVMLTDLYENNIEKATCYWPEENKIKIFDKLIVFHKKTLIFGELIIRSLLIKLKDKPTIREILQIQYYSWPDFGIPLNGTKTLQDLMILTTKFKERAQIKYSLYGPIVIHCSAGIGRTGTFIACHIQLQKLRYNKPINILQTVYNLRKQRSKMVKTFEQYLMIYIVTKDCLKSNILKILQIPKTHPSNICNSDNKNHEEKIQIKCNI